MPRDRSGPPPGDPWLWLAERLEPDHPQFLRGVWWFRHLVTRHGRPHAELATRISDAAYGLATDRGLPARVRVEVARAFVAEVVEIARSHRRPKRRGRPPGRRRM
jgi:hypothetical protein